MNEEFHPTEPREPGSEDHISVVPVPGLPEDAAATATDDLAAPPAQATAGRPADGPDASHTPRRRNRALAATGALVLAGVVGAVAGHAAWQPSPNLVAQTQPFTPSTGGSVPGSGQGGPDQGGSAQGQTQPPAGAAAGSGAGSAVTPAVVDINTTLDYGSGQAAGTGIVVSSDGKVLTNNHVVRGATSISVTDIGNGQTYSATVIGYDRSHDVAVIQLQGASGLATASFGKSSDVAVGDSVVGVGNAGGVGGTPSAAPGSVTGLDQSIVANDAADGTSEPLAGLIQVDANIQAGDSGGPLVNSSGQVIGMDTAGAAGSTVGSGGVQAFAIPIDQALSIAQQIVNGNASSSIHLGQDAFLGVQVGSSASGGPASAFGGSASASGSGVTVGGVVSGTAAAQAGLAAGDVIDSVDGQTVSSPQTLGSVLAAHHPGDQVDITWTSQDGANHTAHVQLTAGPTG